MLLQEIKPTILLNLQQKMQLKLDYKKKKSHSHLYENMTGCQNTPEGRSSPQRLQRIICTIIIII